MCKVCKLIKNDKIKKLIENPYEIVKGKRDKFGIQQEEKKLKKELIKLKLTESEIEQHNINWQMKTGCWIEYRREKEKEKIKQIKEKLMLIQNTEGNCPLCAIHNEWINEGIFYRGWGVDEVSKELQELRIPIIVSQNEIMNHKKNHLSVINKNNRYDDKKTIENVQKSIKKRVSLNNLELKDYIDSQILTLTLDIRRLEDTNLTESKTYKEKIESLRSFIDLKLKSEGGEVQDVNLVNFWNKLKEGKE